MTLNMMPDAKTQTSLQPDTKTRRYDRQLRLWAASGQAALESARVLAIGASATSTSILKNLVLPGIGHLTILDPEDVSEGDAGNNFFFGGPDSIGKSRAREATRYLTELNENVQGIPDTSSYASRLSDASYLRSFDLIIAHNLSDAFLDPLSRLLWSDPTLPPIIIVRSAGFLGEMFIQIREHTIADSHLDDVPTLRLDKPFPALLEHARSLDFDNMDLTDHAHIPYAVILVRALDEWHASHNGNPPKTYQEQQEFKASIREMQRKPDEENFDEALAQAFRVWSEPGVPSSITALFNDPALMNPIAPNANGSANALERSLLFFHLLAALKEFAARIGKLPLTTTLPDMKSDTNSYVHLQKLYRAQAEEERELFWGILRERGFSEHVVDSEAVDEFVRHAHELRVIRGTRWGALEEDPEKLMSCLQDENMCKEAATHLALVSLSQHLSKYVNADNLTKEQMRREILKLLPPGTELPEEIDIAVGEVLRTPTADLPNTAAFLGGLVAQEAIKLITKQYVPVQGTYVVDLIGAWTGAVKI